MLVEVWKLDPKFIVLTDEIRASVIDMEQTGWPIKRWSVRSINVALDGDRDPGRQVPLSLRSVLGTTLNFAIPGSAKRTLFESDVRLESSPLGQEHDPFHVEQTEWDGVLRVLQEKKAAQDTSLVNPLQRDSVLSVEPVNVHLAYGFKTVPDEVPSATSQHLLRQRRPGPSQATKDMLRRAFRRTGNNLTFRITEVIQKPEKDKLSSVFFGILEEQTTSELGDTSTSVQICLKLIDDSLFPFLDEEACKTEWNLQKDHRGLRIQDHSVIEMLRNEVTAYERMKEWQGTLLPYAYGAYKVFVIQLWSPTVQC